MGKYKVVLRHFKKLSLYLQEQHKILDDLKWKNKLTNDQN